MHCTCPTSPHRPVALAANPRSPTYRDEHRRKVCRHFRICCLFDAVDVERIPLVLLQREGTLRLKLNGVEGTQLDVLAFCHVLATQPNDGT